MPPTAAVRWEYYCEGWPSEERLNELGAQGWELVVAVVMSDTSVARRVPEARAEEWGMRHNQNTRFVFKRRMPSL